MDPTLTVAATDVALLGFIWAIVQLVKRLLEETIMPASAPVHDSVVQLIALALGIGSVFVRAGLPATGASGLALVMEGTAVGLGALGVHGLASNALPQSPQLVGVTTSLQPPLPPQPAFPVQPEHRGPGLVSPPTPPDPPRG